MRTRIALVAIIPVALITGNTLTQAADAQSVQAHRTSSRRTTPADIPLLPPNRSVAYRSLGAQLPFTAPPTTGTRSPAGATTSQMVATGSRLTGGPSAVDANMPFDPHPMLPMPPLVTVSGTSTPNTVALHALLAKPPSAPVAATPPPVTTNDPVTPGQREAWEQVALCEEGGDWYADGPEFSGGLGITRANWDAYGGLAFAREGAEATEDQQIQIAERIEPSPPDEDGCRGW
jgi:Transglycosylase-like domain